MEQEREKSEFLVDCGEPMEEEAVKGSSKTQTLAVEDAKVSDSGVENPDDDGSLKPVDGDTGDSVSEDKQVEADDDVASIEDVAENNDDGSGSGGGGSLKAGDGDTGDSVSEEEQVKADEVASVEDVVETEDNDEEESGAVESKDNVEETDKNGESHEIAGEDKGACDDGVTLSATEDKVEEGNNQMDVEGNHEDVDALDAKDSESAQVSQVSTQVSEKETGEEKQGDVSEVGSAAEIRREEENGEAMEIGDEVEEQVEEDVTVGGVMDNAESAGERAVKTDVPVDEAERNDSNVVNEMEIDEPKDNADVANDPTGAVESGDSANPKNLSEDAAPGEVEPLDHNALFDPGSDITNFIDFSGVSSWSGNIQDLKTDTGNVSSLKVDKKDTENVPAVDSIQTLKSGDASVNAESGDKLSLSAEGIENESDEAARVATDCPKDVSEAILGPEENQEDKDQETVNPEDETAHEAPINDPNQQEDTEMEENRNNNFDYADDGTDSDIKTNGVKRKADVLGEDSPGEGRKTVSLAKVSFAERPSFKIGECIARAASQMSGTPSVLKGSNIDDETLSVESFISQLRSAATNPVKENAVSEIATGFFLDFRNSSATEEAIPENVPRKRGRPSNANAGGTEAFEFEEMGDTYWTDRVIRNGGEEQTPPTEKGSYQIVPVELKPAQVQRTRRPYRRRQSQIVVPLPSPAEKKPDFDENAPAELRMNFSETDTIPAEKSLSKMFRHFGPIRESQTEVDAEKNRARVVFRKGADAEVAYNSAGRINIFGTKTVNYELSGTITETFKVQPYVVSLTEEDAGLSLPS